MPLGLCFMARNAPRNCFHFASALFFPFGFLRSQRGVVYPYKRLWVTSAPCHCPHCFYRNKYLIFCELCLANKSPVANSHIPCRVHAVPLSCRATKGLDCVFPIWLTQRGRVWFTYAIPRPCRATTMPTWKRLLKATAQRGMGMACVN
jgi:hypothetical protein